MPDSTLLVHASDLTKRFGYGDGAITAVVEATFDIHAGDLIALVGPSGSGKSTLLHLMAALDVPSGGAIEWPALGMPDQLRPGPVSFAFQGPSLLPPLTVLENVTLPLLLMGAEREAAEVDAVEMIEQLDLTTVIGKLPEELSGGQAQRAGVARALVGIPQLILADEPTGQQDGISGSHVLDVMLQTTGASGAALVIATHDEQVANRLTHRWEMVDRRLETGVRLRSH